VTRRINRAVVGGRATSLQIDPFDFATGGPADIDVLLVQRDALPAEVVEPFLRRVNAEHIRLVADVDDDFFGPEARARLTEAEYDPSRIASVEAVVRAAQTVVVSTPQLRHVVRPLASGRVVVVPNALDREFWVDGDPLHDALVHDGSVHDGSGDIARVLFAGSTTHGDDLALLRDVFDGTVRAPDGRPVRLEVVGVTDRADDGWYDRLPVPDGSRHYPEFVRWMRSRSSRWSAAVAPLTDEPFNRAKSDIKVLDYALLGLPVVASASPAYRRLRRRGVHLVGLRQGPHAWSHALSDAFPDARSREKLRSYVLARRTIGSDSAWEDAVLN
jgi:glycosyltransferase involved in cell wall biosynthesis